MAVTPAPRQSAACRGASASQARVLLAAAFLAAVVAPSAAAAPAPPTHRVGFASVDISPTEPIRLSGFGWRSRESEGVRLPIHARAIAIAPLAEEGTDAASAEDRTVVVIVVETLGIPDAVTERLAARLAERGIARDRLAVCATHTHGAPMLRDCCNTLFGTPIPADQWGRILAYTASLEAKLEAAALAALADRAPATLAHATGRLGFAFNRRTPDGPVDHDLPLLAVRSPDGALRGLVATYACHCVTLSDDLVSGDWAGYAVHHLERRHPGCTALLSIGCGADANPRGGVLGGDAEAADLLGRECADEVDRLLDLPGRAIAAAPSGSLERVALDLAPLPSREGWEERARQGGAVGHHARAQLERLDRGAGLATAIDYPVQTIAFGDELAWVFLPGEVVVDYATRLKRQFDGRRLWIHAYANACPGYVPSERVLREGGYEGGGAMIYYDIPGPYAPGLEGTIVDAVGRRLGEGFAAPDASRTGGVPAPEPSEALAALRVGDGFRVELVAGEPAVASPVALAFGPDGRTWVAEMADYPEGLPDGRPGGRVRCLADDDGDGLPDRSTIFLDGIPFPTGVTPWRDGVLVCAAPDILLARDTDGDGRADTTEVLFTGFATHNYQARVNSLEYGLDGWVEGSCGLFGGEITSLRDGSVTRLGARDFRIDPDRGMIEPAAGCSQQGRVRNDAGDVFGCTNSALAIHYPLPDVWLRRDPAAAPGRTAVSIAAEPGPGTLFPVSQPVLFALSGGAGRATAACGLGIYRDDLLAVDGLSFAGDLFTCEPVNNLVHHQRPVPDGFGWRGTRIESERQREFLASSDPWFRPVQARTGPDGALWVVDMCRYVIEHPVWIPAETLAGLDPRAGAERGRIWRVVATDADGVPKRRPVPRLDRLDGAALAAALDTPNGTVRDLVQQSIRWRDERGALDGLARVARTSAIPAARLQAAWTLATMNALPEGLVAALLGDPSADVRRGALRLAATADAAGDREAGAALRNALEGLAADPDPHVRLEAAAAVDRLAPQNAAELIVAIAARDGGDDLVAAALASALTPGHAREVAKVLAGGPEPAAALDGLLLAAAARLPGESLGGLLDRARLAAEGDPTPASLERLARLIATARVRGHAFAEKERWRPILSVARELLARALDGDEADGEAGADTAAMAAAAVALLGHARYLGLPSADLLARAFAPRAAPWIRVAAAAALRADGGDDVAPAVLAHFGQLAPAARREAVGLLLERRTWAEALLAAVDEGSVARGDIDLATRQALRESAHPAVSGMAARLFESEPGADAGAAIAIHAAAARGGGDGDRGRALFERHCAACHRVDGIGHEVGPDIAAYAAKPAEALVTAILDPHRAVDPRYQAYVVLLDDGRSLTGTIAEETSSGLVVVGPEGRRDAVQRGRIAELRGTGKSLMPEGFDRTLAPEETADLWAWLAARRPPPKTLPGNAPSVVRLAADGSAVLPASEAEIRGGDIVFEVPLANVGMWHGADDSVAWRIDAGADAAVDLWAEWACDPGSAGNRLAVSGLEPAVEVTVASTGGWSRYRLVPLGRARITVGAGEIGVRPAGPLSGALVDLRALHLVAPGTRPRPVGDVVDSSDGAPADSAMPAADAPPEAIAAWLLDGARPEAERAALVERLVAPGAAPAAAGAAIAALAAGLPMPSGSAEEYRRIPWLWRVSVAAGKGGDATRCGGVIAAALPGDGEVLAHWQAVVLGGGIVNGAGLASRWPEEDVAAALSAAGLPSEAWQRVVAAAAIMADDASVPDGTRYDCLRLVALLPPQRAVPHLARYLGEGMPEELRQGATSALVDVRDPAATAALVEALPGLSPGTLEFALRGLVRTEERALALLDAIAGGRLPEAVRGHEAVAGLVDHPSAEVRAAARGVLGADR